jgi:type II secretory pathway pseudopilin PulG
MISEYKNSKSVSGFSLIEVLLAIGTLAVGMLLIAAVFPASINLTAITSERTIAASVADEAFAKIKLYGLSLNDPNWNVIGATNLERVSQIPYYEFAYPSTMVSNPDTKQYWWCAICRKTSLDPLDRNVQVTVFVCRKIGINPSPTYLYRDPINGLINGYRPMPVDVNFSVMAGKPDELLINNPAERNYINDGYTVVDNTFGSIYRVLERYKNDLSTPAIDESQIILLDKTWQVVAGLPTVWVIPPPSTGGRTPCIAVYQKVMNFQ